MAVSARATLLTKTHTVLKKHYKPIPPEERSVLDQVIFALLLEDTSYEAAAAAFDRLRTDYHDWNEVRVCSIRDLTESMPMLADPPRTAGHVRGLLQTIFDKTYDFDLEGIRKLNLGKAVHFLEELRKWPKKKTSLTGGKKADEPDKDAEDELGQETPPPDATQKVAAEASSGSPGSEQEPQPGQASAVNATGGDASNSEAPGDDKSASKGNRPRTSGRAPGDGPPDVLEVAEEMQPGLIPSDEDRSGEFHGATDFAVAYVTQVALGGHRIALDGTSLSVLQLILGESTPEAAATGVDRAIPKAKGAEFFSLLHQFSVDFAGDPTSATHQRILLEVDRTIEDRLDSWGQPNSQEAASAEAGGPETPTKRSSSDRTKATKTQEATGGFSDQTASTPAASETGDVSGTKARSRKKTSASKTAEVETTEQPEATKSAAGKKAGKRDTSKAGKRVKKAPTAQPTPDDQEAAPSTQPQAADAQRSPIGEGPSTGEVNTAVAEGSPASEGEHQVEGTQVPERPAAQGSQPSEQAPHPEVATAVEESSEKKKTAARKKTPTKRRPR